MIPYDAVLITETQMLDLYRQAVAWPKSNEILVGPEQYATLNAFIDNQHRDWRRIKREVNKAARRARRKVLA